MHKLDVYIVENEDPLSISSGGVLSYIVNLGKYLTSIYSKPTLLASGPEIGQPLEKSLPFEIIRVSKKHISNFKYLLLLFINWNKIPNNQNTIIHCQRPDYLFPFILFRRKARLICTLHGMRDFAFTYKKGKTLGKIYSKISGFCLKRADQVIFVDTNSQKSYLKKFPWLNIKSSVIPIGIDLDLFKPQNKLELRKKYNFQSSDKIVIFVGRLEVEKNVDFLVKVCSILVRKIPELKLLIIGGGSKHRYLNNLVTGLKTSCVVFMDRIDNTLIPELLNLSDVLALCSTYEGSPTVVKEALACNIPVISTDVGDVKEVLVDFEGCIISNMINIDYESALEKVLNVDKEFNYQDAIQKYSYKNIFRSTVTIYERTF